MERLLTIYRATSSPVAIALLVAVNLIPLVGAIFWGWNVYTLLILYWIENGIVGVFNVLKMGLAQGPVDTRAGSPELVTPASRLTLIPFFILHYGIFWVVHGVFVMSLPSFIGLGSVGPVFPANGPSNLPGLIFDDGAAQRLGPRWDLVAWGAAGLALSHGASFRLNYVGRGEYRTARIGMLMFAPYVRLVALHLTIIAGGMLSISMGSPVGSMIVLVAIKIAIDLALHIREHRKAAPDGAPGAPLLRI
ncbi:MAG TPA: DUF6498-containing protein [Candidatus Limnocylindrales bacterium]|jgi:hypothetical protein|nr:DUF6498-containing protein [Candidatus Limnocylindrales bacterium]